MRKHGNHTGATCTPRSLTAAGARAQPEPRAVRAHTIRALQSAKTELSATSPFEQPEIHLSTSSDARSLLRGSAAEDAACHVSASRRALRAPCRPSVFAVLPTSVAHARAPRCSATRGAHRRRLWRRSVRHVGRSPARRCRRGASFSLPFAAPPCAPTLLTRACSLVRARAGAKGGRCRLGRSRGGNRRKRVRRHHDATVGAPHEGPRPAGRDRREQVRSLRRQRGACLSSLLAHLSLPLLTPHLRAPSHCCQPGGPVAQTRRVRRWRCTALWHCCCVPGQSSIRPPDYSP